MNDLSDVGEYFVSKPFIASVVIVAITIVLLVIIKKYLIKKVAYTSKDEQHQNTFIGVIFSLLQYAVVLGAAVLVLQLHGVNVTAIVTGLGIVATLIGLALQDTMKDIISGINIYNSNFYKVGDLVKYEGNLCEVKYFSARVTKFTNVATNSTYTVNNSSITSIEKVKDVTLITMTYDFETDKNKIDKCFINALDAIKDEKYVKATNYFGLIDVNNTGLVYACNFTCPGHKANPVKIKFMEAYYEECKKAKISPSFEDERKVRLTK